MPNDFQLPKHRERRSQSVGFQSLNPRLRINQFSTNSLLIPCSYACRLRNTAIDAGARDRRKKFPVNFPVIGELPTSTREGCQSPRGRWFHVHPRVRACSEAVEGSV